MNFLKRAAGVVGGLIGGGIGAVVGAVVVGVICSFLAPGTGTLAGGLMGGATGIGTFTYGVIRGAMSGSFKEGLIGGIAFAPKVHLRESCRRVLLLKKNEKIVEINRDANNESPSLHRFAITNNDDDKKLFKFL